MKIKQFPITLLAYDILMNGENLEDKPLIERKAILKKFIQEHPFKCIRYTEHVLDDGTDMYAKAHEGIIAKRASSRYVHNRSDLWIKLKKKLAEIVQVVGFTEGEGERTGTFGALVLMLNGKYVCNAGTFKNFGRIDRLKISQLLHSRPEMSKPVSDRIVGKTYTAVATALTVRVQFTRWTPDRHMREPVITDVIYPENEDVPSSCPKENTDATEWFAKRYPLLFKQ